MVDVGFCSGMIGVAGVPGHHVTGPPHFLCRVEDRDQFLCLFGFDVVPEVLYDFVHVQFEHESSLYGSCFIECRGYPDFVGVEKFFCYGYDDQS